MSKSEQEVANEIIDLLENLPLEDRAGFLFQAVVTILAAGGLDKNEIRTELLDSLDTFWEMKPEEPSKVVS